jgi:chromosome partitioning protein
MFKIIAISNQKGGVGKTTTAIHLSGALSSQGWKTLLIDLCPSGDTSSTLGFPEEFTEKGAEILFESHGYNVSYNGLLHSIESQPNLQILPATRKLIDCNYILQSYPEEECLSSLYLALQSFSDDFDFIILDVPTSLQNILNNGLVAANGVLVPMTPDPLALDGVKRMLNKVQELRRHNNHLSIIGVIANKIITQHHLHFIQEAKRKLPTNLLLETQIFASQTIEQSFIECGTLQSFASQSDAAQAYHMLSIEILHRLGIEEVPTPECSIYANSDIRS